MPYVLEITDTAAQDLERLIATLPSNRRDEALTEIERLSREFAAHPRHRPYSATSPPTLRLHFVAGGVTHYWLATYRLSEDETTLFITHIFRTTL